MILKKWLKFIGLFCYLVLSIVFLYFVSPSITHMKEVKYDLSVFSLNNEYPINYDNEMIHMENANGQRGIFLDTPCIVIPKGNYTFRLTYYSEYENQVQFLANNDVYLEFPLPAGNQCIEIPISLQQDTAKGQFRFVYFGDGTFDLWDMRCTSDKIICSDPIFYLIVYFILSVIGLYIYFYREKFNIDKKRATVIGILLVLTIITIPYPALFHSGLYMRLDMVGHLARIEGIKTGLQEHQFPVVIYPIACREYGTIGTAYPATFLYFPAILRLLKVSPVCVYKAMLVIINGAIMVSTYWMTHEITKSRKTALLSVLLFAFSVYHLDVIWLISCTLGMGIAIIFAPIVLLGIYQVFFNQKEKWYVLAFGITGMINSHLITALFYVILIGLITLVFAKRLLQEKRYMSMIKAVAFSIFLNLGTLFFLFFALQNKLNTDSLMWNSFIEQALTIGECFTDPGYLLLLICIVLTIGYLFSKRNDKDWLYRYSFLLLIVSVFLYIMCTRVLPWNALLQNQIVSLVINRIQYFLRFHAIIAPAMAFTAAFAITTMKNQALRRIMLMIILVVCTISYFSSIKTDGDVLYTFTGPIFGDIRLTSAATDYAPLGATEDWYSNNWPTFSSEEDIHVSEYAKAGTRINMNYTCDSENQYMDFPLFYYKGYVIEDAKGNALPFSLTEHAKIRVPLEKTNTTKTVNIHYSVPFAGQLLLVVSFLTLLAFICYYIITKLKTKVDIKVDNDMN